MVWVSVVVPVGRVTSFFWVGSGVGVGWVARGPALGRLEPVALAPITLILLSLVLLLEPKGGYTRQIWSVRFVENSRCRSGV